MAEGGRKNGGSNSAGGKGGGGKGGASGGKADSSAWLAVAAGTVGSLMATLDTSIVNAALPTIQGEIGAGPDEATWVSTAYLIAEIVMIPLAGWFQRMLGLRTLLLIVTPAFIVFSMICGLSDSLGMMIVGRLGQGFSGGAMIPTALTIVATRLPPGQRPVGIALFGFTAVMGPVAGPIIGGYLTEAYSWHYAFFINVPIGLGLIVLLFVGLEHTKARLSLIRKADWLGIVGLAMFLGALTMVLEEGQRERWFESAFIVRSAVASAVGLVMLLVGYFTAEEPVIRLELLVQRAFGSVVVMTMMVGMALYGVPYLLPQFLSTFADYDSFQAGLTTFVGGLPPLLMMGLFPVLVKHVDVRVAVAGGLLLYFLGFMMLTNVNQDFVNDDFTTGQLVLGVGQFFCMLFLNQAATSAVSQQFAEDASGLFNAARNLGGSMGLAMIATMRDRRTTFHVTALASDVTSTSPAVQQAMQQAAPVLGMGDTAAGTQMYYGQIQQQIHRVGEALAFSDLFWIMAMLMLAGLPLAFLLRPLPKGGPGAAG